MSSRTFDRETLLDLTVNVIPLGILVVFTVLFLVYSPSVFAWDSVFSTIQFAIIGTTFVLLAILTYYAGKAIAGAEKELGIHAQTATYDPDAESTDHETEAAAEDHDSESADEGDEKADE